MLSCSSVAVIAQLKQFWPRSQFLATASHQQQWSGDYVASGSEPGTATTAALGHWRLEWAAAAPDVYLFIKEAAIRIVIGCIWSGYMRTADN